MNPIINNMLVVPIHPDRVNTDSYACCLFDRDTGEYKFLSVVDDKTKKLKEQLKNAKGTLLFVHNKVNVYGILRDSKKTSKPNLYWIDKRNIELIKDDILNYNERYNIIDISDEDISIFRGQYDKKRFSLTRITDHKMLVPIAYEKFIESLKEESNPAPVIQGGQSNIVANTIEEVADNIEESDDITTGEEDTTIKEDASNHCEVENEQCEDSNEAIADKYFNDSDNDKSAVTEEIKQTKSNCETDGVNPELVKALVEATSAMTETMKELKKTTDSYKETMAKSFGEFDLDVETKFVGVADIKGSTTEADDSLLESTEVGLDTIYDFILKIMKVDDTISVPRTYYEKLTTIIKRNMMLSRDGNSYDSIILIKFNRASKENIVARVEYDITKEYTRITIIKSYSSVELTDKQMVEYEIKFNQWRRMHSYRTSD